MTRLPVLSGDEFVAAVKRFGLSLDRIEGSLMIRARSRPRPGSRCRGTESRRPVGPTRIRDAGLTREEFVRLLD